MTLSSYFFVSKRFLFRRKQSALKSACIAIALSLIPLITAIEVTDSMEKGILSRSIETASYHLQAASLVGNPTEAEIEQLVSQLEYYPEVKYVAVERRNAAIAFTSLGRSGVMVRAIDRDFLKDDLTLSNYLRIEEHLVDDRKGDSIMIGRPLAARLGVTIGDRLRLMSAFHDGQEFLPQIHSFTVTTIFSTGYEEIDKNWTIIPMTSMQELFNPDQSQLLIGIKVWKPFDDIEALSYKMNRELNQQWIVYHWKVLNAFYIQNIQTTRALLMVVLGLIVAIAVVNTSGSLYIFYLQNRESVAILKAMGMTPKQTENLFIWCGALVGLVGSLLGLAIGSIVAININNIINSIEFISKLFNGHTDFSFYIDHISVQINISRLIIIAISVTVLASLSCWIPARKASKGKALLILRNYI